MKRLPLLLGLLFLGFSVNAVQRGDTAQRPDVRVTTGARTSQAKPAWQFTDDERIALRTNAALAGERVAEHRQSHAMTKTHTSSADRQQLADAFEGKSHPELFLPHEVFRNFVGLAFEGDARMREVVRHGMTSDVRKAGFPPDFWERLEAITAVHIADVRTERDLLTSRSKLSGAARERVAQSLELKHDDVCLSRAEALAAARNAFGRERFDHFLYEAVAINMFHVSDRLPTPEQLRTWEGGCR